MLPVSAAQRSPLKSSFFALYIASVITLSMCTFYYKFSYTPRHPGTRVCNIMYQSVVRKSRWNWRTCVAEDKIMNSNKDFQGSC